MIFDEVCNHVFVLERESRIITCFDLASKDEEDSISVCYEAQGDLLHFSAAYRDSKNEPLILCIVDSSSKDLKLLRMEEK